MKTSKFIASGEFDEIYFTRNKTYEGTQYKDTKLYEVTCDKGHKRFILPNSPSPHLIRRFINEASNYYIPCHNQVCAGEFLMIERN